MRTVLNTVSVEDCHNSLIRCLHDKRPCMDTCMDTGETNLYHLSNTYIYQGKAYKLSDSTVNEIPYSVLESQSIDFAVIGCSDATNNGRHISFEPFGDIQLTIGEWLTVSEFAHKYRCSVRHVFAMGEHYIGSVNGNGEAVYFRTVEPVSEPLIEVTDGWTRVHIRAGVFNTSACLRKIAYYDCVTYEILQTELRCPHCGERITGALRLDEPGGLYYTYGAGIVIHYNCLPVCDECGERIAVGEGNLVEGGDRTRRLCNECLTRGMLEGTIQHCDNCGAYTYDSTEWTRFGRWKICPECAKNVIVCKECGRPVAGDSTAEAIGVCRSCYDEHNYHVNSYASWEDNVPLKYLVDGETVRYSDDLKVFGLELEVGGAYDADGIIDDNRRYSGGKWVLDYERDSSLYYGFETITQPMNKATFDMLDWEGILRNYSSRGYKSYSDNTFSCGLHIHFNRPAFLGDTKIKEEHSLSKLYVFFTEHWRDLVKASRRENLEWCDLDIDLKGYSGAELRNMADYCAKFKKGLDHHTAINNGNRHTVEVRLGAGTLDHVEFRSWVDLMYTIMGNIRKISNCDVSKGHLWLRGISSGTAEWLRKIGAFTEELDTLGM